MCRKHRYPRGPGPHFTQPPARVSLTLPGSVISPRGRGAGWPFGGLSSGVRADRWRKLRPRTATARDKWGQKFKSWTETKSRASEGRPRSCNRATVPDANDNGDRRAFRKVRWAAPPICDRNGRVRHHVVGAGMAGPGSGKGAWAAGPFGADSGKPTTHRRRAASSADWR